MTAFVIVAACMILAGGVQQIALCERKPAGVDMLHLCCGIIKVGIGVWGVLALAYPS